MEIEQSNLSWSVCRALIRETWRGKSIARTLMNYELSKFAVNGRVLDLGSKSSEGSYNRFLNRTDGTDGTNRTSVTYTDIAGVGENVIKLDLEEPFTISADSYDSVTCFNTLEHIYNNKNVVEEAYRILKPGGALIGGTPFLVNFHPDPHDYFRYTHEALAHMFAEVGFEQERMIMLGFGPLTAGAAMFLHAFPRFLRLLVVLKAVLLDALILKWKPSQRGKYALGYVYVFRK